MATHDYNLANASGASFRADLNNALQAILTNNSSASAPSTTASYMFWADTNTGILKIRNSANDAWVELLQLDGTLTLEDGSASAVALGFRDELNTGIFSSGANNFDVSIAGTTRLNISASGINITGTVTDDGATHDGDVTFTGASANIVFDKSDNALEFADNAKAKFGNAGDLEIFHNGSNSVINDAGTGTLILQIAGNDILSLTSTGVNITDPNGEAICQVTGFEGNDAAVQLVADQGDDNGDRWKLVSVASDNTFRLQNNVSGSNVNKWTISTDGDVNQTGHLDLADDKALRLGNSDDFQLFHRSSDKVSIIAEYGASYLSIQTNGSKVEIFDSANNTNMAEFFTGGGVYLRYAGTTRFNTTSSGAKVTGDFTISGTQPFIQLDDTNNENDFQIGNNGGTFRIRDTDAAADRFTITSAGVTSVNTNFVCTGQILAESTGPNISMKDTNASSNNKQWDFKLTGSDGTFTIQALNDSGGGGGNLFEMTRSGNSIQTFVGKKSGSTWFTVDNNARKVTTYDLDVNNDLSISQQFFISNGSAGSPSLTFNNTTNMGFYRHSANQIGVSISGTGNVRFKNDQFGPQFTNTIDLGQGSLRFQDIFLMTNPNVSSDQNVKNTIATSDLGLDFINKLNPVSFKYNEGTRTHYGLIAQEIETVLGAISKSTTDFAGFCKDEVDEDGNAMTPIYGLRYSEFISPIIKAIQELSTKVAALEAA